MSTAAVVVVVVVLAVALRVARRRRRHNRTAPPGGAAGPGPEAAGSGPEAVASGGGARRTQRSARRPGWASGAIPLVAAREIRERARSRMFRVGTLVILAGVAAGVVVPVLVRGSVPRVTVGVVGTLSAPLRVTVVAAGKATGAKVSLVAEPSVASAERGLRSGRLNVVILDARRLVVDEPIVASDTSATALMVRAVALEISLQNGLVAAGLSPLRAAELANPAPLPVTSLQPPPHNTTARTTAVYGVILIFVLLSQYGTWILLGVVEEKSSRVVEVLLSTLRPLQLLAGKVIGIGLMALAQGSLIVAVALGLADAVGSDLVKGTAPVEVVCVLVWLVLGYAFYSWVYAAAGSLAERQEHVQTLVLPLQLPMLFGYIVSLTALGSGQASALVTVLAYLPPTAPFAMSVLVALGKATWWEVVTSAGLSVVATAGVARVAAVVYGRAVLRTGRRVRLREVLSS